MNSHYLKLFKEYKLMRKIHLQQRKGEFPQK